MQELVDLAADVTQVQVGSQRVGHVAGQRRAQVDPDAPRHRQRLHCTSFAPRGAFEQADMGRHDQVIVALIGKGGDQGLGEAAP
jgi:hypothetical protein